MNTIDSEPVPKRQWEGHVPNELAALVVGHSTLTRSDLLRVSGVSKSFWHEAQRLLHRTVALTSLSQIIAYIRTVSSHPHLAEYLHSLTLHMPPQVAFQGRDIQRLSDMLDLAKKLKQLRVLPCTPMPPAYEWEEPDAVHAWILEGHKFKLDVFLNSYFRPAELVPFLASQPTLIALALDCIGTLQKPCRRGRGAVVTLPRVRHLICTIDMLHEICSVGPLYITNLNVQIACRSVEADRLLLNAVQTLRGTLNMLQVHMVHCQVVGTTTMPQLIWHIAECVPNLRALRVEFQYIYVDRPSPQPFSLQPNHFRKLERICLRSPLLMASNFDASDCIGYYSDLDTPVGRTMALERILHANPTLRNVTIINPRGAQEFVMRRKRMVDAQGNVNVVLHVLCRTLLPDGWSPNL